MRQALPERSAPGLVLDLVATAMAGGAAVPRATAIVRRACERAGLPVGARARRGGVCGGGGRADGRPGRRAPPQRGGSRAPGRRDMGRAGGRASRGAPDAAARGLRPAGAFLALAVVPMLLAVVSSTLGHP
ncbi:hypothetical protein [Clavibacter zhangzhiyongii]|uniref:hypothetical protein n=1 Tax=Clavibacter zhangzhiyongii TaxID=2768071 RepID=UPI0039DFB487